MQKPAWERIERKYLADGDTPPALMRTSTLDMNGQVIAIKSIGRVEKDYLSK